MRNRAKKVLRHAEIATHGQVSRKSVRIYFHGPPVCTIHRSVSGDAITSNGIQK
jgi:hypothetical protein